MIVFSWADGEASPFLAVTAGFDPRCPKCRRFVKRSTAQGCIVDLGDRVEAMAECAKCGRVELDIVGYGDEIAVAVDRDGRDG